MGEFVSDGETLSDNWVSPVNSDAIAAKSTPFDVAEYLARIIAQISLSNIEAESICHSRDVHWRTQSEPLYDFLNLSQTSRCLSPVVHHFGFESQYLVT